MADGIISFLVECKIAAQANRLQDLIISDQEIMASPMLFEQQILVSQYSRAMLDPAINPTFAKSSSHYSMPVLFALLEKAARSEKLELLDQLIGYFFRDSCFHHRNKHIVMFNRVKILEKMGDFKKATFACENLLKEIGDGSDYYTFEFLKLLKKLGRSIQATKIAQRHLESERAESKHKIQSAYIEILSEYMQKDPQQVLKKIETSFHNRKISITNIYNLGILLKQKYPIKAIQIFRQVVDHLKQQFSLCKLSTLAKINIINLHTEHNIPTYPQKLNKLQIKEILQECENLYGDLFMVIEENQEFQSLMQKNHAFYNKIMQEIRNQGNAHLLLQIATKKKIMLKDFKFMGGDEESELQSQANKTGQSNYTSVPANYFQEKRAENEKRLRFLLNKEKQLKHFFKKLRVERDGSKINIKVTDKKILGTSYYRPYQSFTPEELAVLETKFQDKQKQLNTLQQSQINSVISKFIEQWITPYQKSNAKIRNPNKMKQFIVTLLCSTDQAGQACEQDQEKTSKSKQRSNMSNTCRTSQQGFRVKHLTLLNSSRKGSDQVLDALKSHNYGNISNKMITNLKSSIVDKKKEDRSLSILSHRNFKQMVREGEVFENQDNLEEAHQHYVKMYKIFKDDQEKQILLMKIASNYEKLGFYQEAERTYSKCAKFNSMETFFRLGRLQIRMGKVQAGIQNLEKANCIDRNNIRIEIQLVYGYSLLEETSERALALANSILSRNPECLQALIMSSKILQKKGKLKQALEIALAIGNTVRTAGTYHYIGLLYLNDSNVSQAYHYFNKALECDENHIPSLIELATIISQSKTDEAIQILKGVIAVDPKNQLAFARLGKIYESFRNDHDNALIIYKRGLESAPSYQNYIKIGDCHLKKGAIYDAYYNYKQALSIQETADIYEKIAQVHEMQNEEKKAVSMYALALKELLKDGSNGNLIKQKKYLQKLGKLSLINQDFQAAYGYLSEALELESSFQILKMLGETCYGKGEYSQALQYFEQASAMVPQDNIQLLEHIAVCYDKQQNYLTSKQIYQKILSIEPRNIKSLNNLANILLIIGKASQAFYWYEYMLQQCPNNIERRLRIADIYATIGDWSKVEQHLMICHRQKENDIRVLEKLVNLYKEKRDTKQIAKYEKRLGLIKNSTSRMMN